MNEPRKRNQTRTALVVPEYLPAADFVVAALRSDEVLLADTFRYGRQSSQNRCRVRTPDGWQWLTVPVVGGQHGRSIRATRVDLSRAPLGRHWKSIVFNYQSTPYFEHYEHEVRGLFEHVYESLGELTVQSSRVLCRLLGASATMTTISAVEPGIVGWLSPEIAQYAPGLIVLDRQAPELDGGPPSIRVAGLAIEYRQNFPGFVAGLSALDILFNLGPEARSVLENNSQSRIAEPRRVWQK